MHIIVECQLGELSPEEVQEVILHLGAELIPNLEPIVNNDLVLLTFNLPSYNIVQEIAQLDFVVQLHGRYLTSICIGALPPTFGYLEKIK